jgi:hypothetical protein
MKVSLFGKTEERDTNLERFVTRVINEALDRVLIEEPFDYADYLKEHPFCLWPKEMCHHVYIERKISSSLGVKLYEALAAELLPGAERQYKISGFVDRERLRRIEKVLHRLEFEKHLKPNWDWELSYILDGNHGKMIPTDVVCDYYNPNTKIAVEIKSPYPNSDQCKVTKQKLLKLYAMESEEVKEAYFGLTYNPHGFKKEHYNWTPSFRWFNMTEDDVVLIGKGFWDKVGGDGTCKALGAVINNLRGIISSRIRAALASNSNTFNIDGKVLNPLFRDLTRLKKHFDENYRSV